METALKQHSAETSGT